ncbi:MAG: hypothetical protein HY043_07775 [Verrucomicrobia bacterium]|nr:hypothetical protein [Verrucomicrobiota bacterium]
MWTFVFIIIAFSVGVNFVVKRLPNSLAVVCIAGGFLNVAHEFVNGSGSVRPADLFFWIPMIAALGALVSLPIGLVVGIPFYFFRKSAKRTKVNGE